MDDDPKLNHSNHSNKRYDTLYESLDDTKKNKDVKDDGEEVCLEDSGLINSNVKSSELINANTDDDNECDAVNKNIELGFKSDKCDNDDVYQKSCYLEKRNSNIKIKK